MKSIKEIRADFLLDPKINYLNHGAFGACPLPVFNSYQAFQRQLEKEPVQFFLKEGNLLLNESKSALAHYINCDSEDLIYVQNPTAAMNLVIKGLQLKEGEEILTTNQEYGAIDKTWKYYCKKTGAKYISQKIELPIISKEKILEQFWAGYSSKTKYIFLSQITSTTALIFPVKEICEKAKALGLITIIDGAHVPGHIPLDLSKLEADIYTGANHKWLLAPKGNSFLYINKSLKNNFDPLIISWGYDLNSNLETQFNDYHQHNGTRDYSAYLSIPTAIKYMRDNDWEIRKQNCHALLLEYYPKIAKALNSSIICPLSGHYLGQICSVPIQTNEPNKLRIYLYEKHQVEIGMMISPIGNFIRTSFQPYSDENDIINFIEALKATRKLTNLLR